jgi:hypothetical protein
VSGSGPAARVTDCLPPRTSVLLHPTRSMRVRLALMHAGPGLVLFWTGIGILREGTHLLMAWAAIAAGGAVVAAVLLELLKPESHERESIAWVDVAAGLMLIVEGFHVRHPGRLLQPALFYFLAGAASIGVGAGQSRLRRMKRLDLSEEGFSLRATQFRRLDLPWRRLAAFETLPDALLVVTADGQRRRIGLGSVANREEMFRGFAGYAERFMAVSDPVPADPAGPGAADAGERTPGATQPTVGRVGAAG